MQWPDYVVLVGYFILMGGIGAWAMRTVHVQEDYFMGGRSFGKLLQTFAAFGAGTGSSDPVNTGRTTFTSGMSGMWSVMYWLFVTPFYWITGVWYRRMRHLTLGDWFVERYESKLLGAAYAVFGIIFYIYYGSMLFSAIGKVAAPLIGSGDFQFRGQIVGIEYILVPIIGIVVLVYGILGGLRAAYFTDLIQGVCIILLSILLIPYGLEALVERFGRPDEQGMMHGFRILHEQLPPEYFRIAGSSNSSEFPLHRIIAVVIINLVGIVVQPHFIATGGGSAKTETTARVGLVLGNFLKRLCTVGWVLTALVALALYAGSPELAEDPDKTWGVASRELLGPGLTGLMLACLLAALMSSVDAYMIVGSGLIVRNIYAAFVDRDASERVYVNLARLTGGIIVGGAVAVSLLYMDVFGQLQLTWIIPVLFAAPFWVGMYWRRATTTAAWTTLAFSALVFFLIPAILPAVWPQLREHEAFLDTNRMVETESVRQAAPSDVARGTADQVGDEIPERRILGGQSIFWTQGVKPIDSEGQVIMALSPIEAGPPTSIDATTTETELAYPEGTRLQGQGSFRLDFLLYKAIGVPLTKVSDAMLSTLELPPKIITPFVVMILASWLSRRNSDQTLDRYYIKMRTPVDADPRRDQSQLNDNFLNPELCPRKKLFPNTDLEFQKPTWVDVVGFIACFAACFGIIGLAVWIARIGI